MTRLLMTLAVLCTVHALTTQPTEAVTISMLPVGNPGNGADPSTGHGAVAYNYNIGAYDVTVGQYAEFLNAVAAADPYGIYNTNMATDQNTAGISRFGSPGSYTYSVIGNSSNLPIAYVSWGGAARFANWVQNGQPTGVEGPGTTETGSYTLNGITSDAGLNSITRNTNAAIFIPSVDEWYKAAYYDPSTNSYNVYPFSSSTLPTSAMPGNTPNTANFRSPSATFAATGSSTYDTSQNYLTPVGSYTASTSPYGAFDMGGNVQQWTEELIRGTFRGTWGSTWFNFSAGESSSKNGAPPTRVSPIIGFRLASVPEPSTYVLGTSALGAVWAIAMRKRAMRHRQNR